MVCGGYTSCMNAVGNLVLRMRIWKDHFGQDLIEYALLTGFVALAAGATFPAIADNLGTIFEKVNKTLRSAAGGIRTDSGL